MELLKAIVIFRKHCADEQLQLRDADARALIAVTAVCRFWSRTVAATIGTIRRHLRLLFPGKQTRYHLTDAADNMSI